MNLSRSGATRPGRGALGVILGGSLVASAWPATLGKFFSWLLLLPAAVMETANALLSFVVIAFMFGLIYRLLPDVEVPWRSVWIGAAVTAFLFTVGKSLIGLHLGRSTMASVYGATGSLVILLLWIYDSAQILFFGAEFTKVYSRRAGGPADRGGRHDAAGAGTRPLATEPDCAHCAGKPRSPLHA